MSNTEPMDNILILNDADGNAVRFEFLDLIPYGGHEYVVLYPVDVDDGDVVILMVDEDPNVTEESYVAVEDDAIVQAVFRIFKEMNKEEYTFTDNDSPNTVASSGDKPVKYRARLGVLLVAWFGAWRGLHYNWMGYHEQAARFRRNMGGIFCIINPICWIMHVVEQVKVIFGGYRVDAYGRPIRYFSLIRNLVKK